VELTEDYHRRLAKTVARSPADAMVSPMLVHSHTRCFDCGTWVRAMTTVTGMRGQQRVFICWSCRLKGVQAELKEARDGQA